MSDDGTSGRHGRLEATVRGTVQGVGFRAFVVRRASRLGLHGWVANDADGSVRVVAEGDRTSLEALGAALEEGPPGAWVREVSITWAPPSGTEPPFRLRAGAHRGD